MSNLQESLISTQPEASSSIIHDLDVTLRVNVKTTKFKIAAGIADS